MKTVNLPLYVLSDPQLAQLITALMEVGNEVSEQNHIERAAIEALQDELDRRGSSWRLEDGKFILG